MKTKKAIILILFMVSSLISLGQCKFKRNEVDEFTKKTIRETKPVSVAGVFSQNYTVALKQVNENYYLNFAYGSTGTFAMVIGEGDELMFKFDNDSVLTLESLEIASASHYYSQYANSTGISCSYGITREQLETLARNKTVKIRFYTSEGYYEKETKSDGIEKMRSNAKCMLN